MTSNSGDPGDHRPDLTKQPDNSDTPPVYTPPVNPYPEHPTYASPSADQFVPYTPPQYGDPLQTQYPAERYPESAVPQQPEVPRYPTHHYAPAQYPAAPYPVPGFEVSAVRLQPAAVGATRILGAVTLVGALLFIAYGWLTWASFDPRYTEAPTVSVNGWGQVFQNGSQITLDAGTAGTPFATTFIPFFALPVAILAVLIICNIGRFGNAIAILVLAVLHLILALSYLAVPSTCIIFDDDEDSVLFEGLNDFSTGPGAILATMTLLIVVGTSITGIILGRKKTYPAPALAPGYGAYPGH
ncbi:hypothetical protein [Williamsia sp.]|uniref:hypothetical protein n=1 Tax=Williamsia sp. TaxID=1872085 RepID=UPI002F94B5BC